jgi:hypothetical protein
MYVQRGSGGWVTFYWDKDATLVALVRFVPRDDGRLEMAELHLASVPRLTSEAYRSLPLTAMEAWANGVGREELIEAIEESGEEIRQATAEWLRVIRYGSPSMILDAATASSTASMIGTAAGSILVEGDPDQAIFTNIKAPTTRSLRLRIPPGTKRPDSFYRRVAELYSALSASGTHRPAQMIAEANDVPVTTVRRWIKEARARNVLAPADRAGRAG